MASVNKVIILGNLGRDPETRHMGNGDAVASFSIATTEKWKDKQGEKMEKTEWHNVVFFGRTAEVAAQYLKKGSQCYVEGRLQTDKYTDKEGNEKYTTKIIGERLQLLGSGGKSEGRGQTEQRSRSSAPAPQQKQIDDFDSDIPFIFNECLFDVGSKLARRLGRYGRKTMLHAWCE